MLQVMHRSYAWRFLCGVGVALMVVSTTLGQSSGLPRVTHTAPVAPDILAIEIDAGSIIPSKVEPDAAQPGDERQVQPPTRTADTDVVELIRNGNNVGYLIGVNRDYLATREGFQGSPLDTKLTGRVESYLVQSGDDPAFATAVRPVKVARKSKPIDWQRHGKRNFVMRHTIYLSLPAPLREGATYTIDLSALKIDGTIISYKHDPFRTRSEAVHAIQTGYRPDDPVKHAFLSIWLGTGGRYAYTLPLKYQLICHADGKIVHTGEVEPVWAGNQPERMKFPVNNSLTDVYRMNFSHFSDPGTYRVYVEGIGCSYPFEIRGNPWQNAFLVSMKGLFNQRSGIELGLPYTDFKRPPALAPQTCVMPVQSTFAQIDTPRGGKRAMQGAYPLGDGATDQKMPQAWGGYHDAGDFNPRAMPHAMVTAFLQLELMEMFPGHFDTLSLNIPREYPQLPDLLNEILFEVDLFKRLQHSDGGVPYGIESRDPRPGDVSWRQALPMFVYAPDCYSSFQYAAMVSRAARVIARYDPAMSAEYVKSALTAMQWGESDYQTRIKADEQAAGRSRGPRQLAAIELYRTTKDRHWLDLFLDISGFDDDEAAAQGSARGGQSTALFSYAMLPDADAKLREKAVAMIEAAANDALQYAEGNAFGLTNETKTQPMFYGFYSTPGALSLPRAHHLTGKAQYLAGLIRAYHFPLGANPFNQTYTTGLGANPTRNPHHLDSRQSGQPAPIGITVYGNADLIHFQDNNGLMWPVTNFLDRICIPPASKWPTHEAYFDIWGWPAMNEWTTQQVHGPQTYYWGYLSARAPLQ